MDDYLREVRPLFDPPRTYQRSVYRPGEICQFDLWEPVAEIPVGFGQTRRSWVVIACLGYSRAGAGALVFSKQTQDLLWGVGRCLVAGGATRDAGLGPPGRAACARRPTHRRLHRLLGSASGRLALLRGGRPAGQGGVERLQGYAETNFEPGRTFVNHLDFQLQLDAWFDKVNARQHRALRCRPVDRLVEEREVMAPLPARPPDTDRRWVLRVPPDPYLRFDTCDHSLDAALAGRRVEARVSDREVSAVCLDTGELACRHERSFARHRTITALEHARALKASRGERDGEPTVEIRPLARYDALIA